MTETTLLPGTFTGNAERRSGWFARHTCSSECGKILKSAGVLALLMFGFASMAVNRKGLQYLSKFLCYVLNRQKGQDSKSVLQSPLSKSVNTKFAMNSSLSSSGRGMTL